VTRPPAPADQPGELATLAVTIDLHGFYGKQHGVCLIVPCYFEHFLRNFWENRRQELRVF
jgi:hypothetical protein